MQSMKRTRNAAFFETHARRRQRIFFVHVFLSHPPSTPKGFLFRNHTDVTRSWCESFPFLLYASKIFLSLMKERKKFFLRSHEKFKKIVSFERRRRSMAWLSTRENFAHSNELLKCAAGATKMRKKREKWKREEPPKKRKWIRCRKGSKGAREALSLRQ